MAATPARDERGRQLRSVDETLLGAGFIVEVDDHGTWRRRKSGVCWVNVRRYIAGEHRFGRIVIQPVEEQAIV